MSVRKRVIKTKSGTTVRWEASVTLGNGDRVRRLFATKAEAVQTEADIKSKDNVGAFRKKADQVTLAEHLQDYLEKTKERAARGEIVAKYARTIAGHINNYICATPKGSMTRSEQCTNLERGIGHLKLRDLDRGRIEDFRDALRNAGMTVDMTRAVMRTLHSALERAVAKGLLVGNPAHSVRVKGARNEKVRKRSRPPEPFMIERLLKAADLDFRVRLLFAVVTGVRAGEQLALRWRHVDFERGFVQIETRINEDLEEDDQGPKSDAGTRKVPLGPPILTALKAWRSRTKFPHADDLIFPNRKGGFSSHSAMCRNRWRPLVKEVVGDWKSAPLGPTYNWHSLRHFTASAWVATGVNWKKIQVWIGHGDIAFTMNRYGHLFEDGADAEILTILHRLGIGDAKIPK